MSVFTVDEKNDEVYAAVNPHMRFAIDIMDGGYSAISTNNDHGSIAHWHDSLLPAELKALDYQPAITMMDHWINLFFANRSRGGLIPTLARMSGRKIYDIDSSMPQDADGWYHSPGDLRSYGVLEGRYASTVKMIRRIHYFLQWFPNDLKLKDNSLLRNRCMEWADAFMQANDDNWYGHRVSSTSWMLHNFVHTGPRHLEPGEDEHQFANPVNFSGDFNQRFDQALRFAFEGFPDSWRVMVDEYGAVAQAFVHLAKDSGEAKYDAFAKKITEGLWNARLNHATYLMPDTVTPGGPLPGDQAQVNNQWKHLHDTDCLYWARALFDAYGLLGNVHPELAGSRQQDLWCTQTHPNGEPTAMLHCRIRPRRKKVSAFLQNAGFPEGYLGMALGLTLDWVRCGWDPNAKQFRRKICLDGKPGPTMIYGDGKWNTLYVLIEAYRFTQDSFYLDIFDQAWGQLKTLAGPLGGLFPHTIENGLLPPSLEGGKCWASQPSPAGVECYQEFFLDVIVSAYLATVQANQPRASYLADAQALADKLRAEHDMGRSYYKLSHGVLGGALIRLAQAQGAMRRIAVKLSEDNVAKLVFAGTAGITEVEVSGHKRAVVYIDADSQAYQVTKRYGDGSLSTPVSLQVVNDVEITL